MNNGKACLSLSFLLLLPAMSPAIAQITSVDRFVPHVSTVSANEGAQVGLYLHEKIDAALQAQIAAGASPQDKVVLFIHGVSVTSAPAFDLPYKDYSWMEFLASQGFDTFSMDHQGYGYSPQPHMDNPCNLSAEDQASIDAAATANCRADYQRQLTSSQTDWDEIDTVVDYLRELRGVDKVSIIGWSLGGIRTGGYAANHGEKLDKLVLFAPVYRQGSAATAPSNFPVEAAPLSLQTKDTLLNNRWGSNVACENQVEEGIAEVAWQAIMSYDRFGSSWNKPDGVMRVRSASYWGWDEEAAAKISNPTLILIGEQDGLLPGAVSLYGDLSGIRNKAVVRMECATHFAVWEASQYKFMQEASLEWLNEGTYRGNSIGEFKVAYGGMNLD
tara:strand:+ start:1758 stop:2918 length:1161 start_codon:yes stop_codon:yes gene_type:complete